MRGVGRPVAIAALVAALLAGLLIVLNGDGRYTVTARFTDASQLVKGNRVQIGGRPVGEVKAIKLGDDGVAEVELELTDEDAYPLHEGTRATVRALGLSGVANRFVDIAPGPPSTRELPEGGTIGLDNTRGVVDLDVLLNGVDEDVRADVRSIIGDLAGAFTPKGARQVNDGLGVLNPAISQVTELGRELTADEAALRSVVAHSASLSRSLAQRRGELGSGLRSGAAVMSAVASERRALGESIERAPASLRGTTATLRRLRTRTLPVLDPVVRDVRPSLAPLEELLALVPPTLDDARPLLRSVRALTPRSARALEPLPRLQRAAAPALSSGAKSLSDALPVIRGLRPYTPEIVAGFFSGFGGATGHSYDANGHYTRVSFQAGRGTPAGLLPLTGTSGGGGYKSGFDARCPGAAEGPAPDNSNPWPISSCTTEDNQK